MSITLCAVRCAIPLLVAKLTTDLYFADMTTSQIVIQAVLILIGAYVIARTSARAAIEQTIRIVESRRARASRSTDHANT